MQVQEIVQVGQQALTIGAYCLAGLVVFATTVARFTPTKKDDEIVEKIADGSFKFISWLPTLGLNPNTKKLQEAYQEQRDEIEKLKAELAKKAS